MENLLQLNNPHLDGINRPEATSRMVVRCRKVEANRTPDIKPYDTADVERWHVLLESRGRQKEGEDGRTLFQGGEAAAE